MDTTIGQLLLAQALPPELHHQLGRPLDKRGIAALAQELADKHPDQYGPTMHKLVRLGQDVSSRSAAYSVGIDDLATTPGAQRVRSQIRRELARIYAQPDLSPSEREQQVIAAIGKYQKPLEEEIYQESRAEHNPLALMVQSGSRGNPNNLRSLRGADLLYVDHHNRVIPIPVLSSYSEGLRPHEFWAGSFGARKGVADTKFMVRDAGYLAKLMNQVTHRLVVTAADAAEEPDPQLPRGLPVPVSDPDNAGALLARTVGRYPRNTVLTPPILHALAAAGHQTILVRSPLVGGPPLGGVYGRDVGVRERGAIAPRGDYVGLAASQALSEKVTQSGLSSKHTGGVAGAGHNLSGFARIQAMLQVPHIFPAGATHARTDGRVTAVTPAAQGGHTIQIAGSEHYVPGDQRPTVAAGDEIEAGDVLSDGLPNPAELVAHKGIGEGRRQFVNAFMRTYKDVGIGGHRRNVELLARGLIDHVRMTDEQDDWLPDDVISYTALEHQYTPRPGALPMRPAAALGRYLEQPVLHHTIGTKIRKSMLPEFQAHGVGKVLVHPDPPPFEPVMIRGADNLMFDPDWMTRQLGTNLQKSVTEAVHRGRSSDPEGTSYVPALAERAHFGHHGATRGWNPRELHAAPAP